MIVRRISDQICAENGLSIIDNPKPSRGHYGTWLGDDKKPNMREQLQQAIDAALLRKPRDFNEFLAQMEAEHYEEKRRGNRFSFRGAGKGFICLRSLKGDYTEDAIRERIDGRKTVQVKHNTTVVAQPQKLNLLIDIQNSIKAQNSPGYAQWSKIFNLKTAASTLVFLQENGLDDIEKLRDKAQKAKDDFNGINTRIQAIDTRLGEITALQKHIGMYSKTREIYAAYRKAGYSKKFFAEHSGDITVHKDAKKYFDSVGLKKLPTINALKTEYSTLSAEKKKLYGEYHTARKYMQEILNARQNAESLLNYRDTAQTKENERT